MQQVWTRQRNAQAWVATAIFIFMDVYRHSKWKGRKTVVNQTVESGDREKAEWNINGNEILTSFFYWTVKFWECSVFAAAYLLLFKVWGILKSNEKTIKWSVQTFYRHVHSLQIASYETYSAMICRQWRRSFFALTCCVIILWQPEAYKWIQCREQVLVGCMHASWDINMQSKGDTYTQPYWQVDVHKTPAHTSTNTYTETTTDKRSFIPPSKFTSFIHPKHTFKYLLFLILQ